MRKDFCRHPFARTTPGSIAVHKHQFILGFCLGKPLTQCTVFNIDSLAVGVTDDPTISRITIIVDSGNSVVEQVEKQLNKLVDVIKVRTLEENNLIGRELMILKVNANNKTRQDIMTICEIMGAKVDDISPSSMTMELSDTPERLDTFQSMMRPFSILEVARTGVIAVQKGGGKI